MKCHAVPESCLEVWIEEMVEAIPDWIAEGEDNQLEGRHDTQLDEDDKIRWVVCMAKASKDKDGQGMRETGQLAVGNSENIDGSPP